MTATQLKIHDKKLVRETWNSCIDRIDGDVAALLNQFKIRSWDPWWCRTLANLRKDILKRKIRTRNVD